LVVTRGKATGSVLTSMRKLLRAYLAMTISKSKKDDLIVAVVQKQLQRNVVQQLRRLHPVGACEIRMLEFLPPEKAKEVGLKITLPPEHLPDFGVKKKEEPVAEKAEPAPEAA
jgi:ribosomal protein S3AE